MTPPVAVVVSPRTFAVLEAERLERQGETIGDAFAELRALDVGRIAVPRRRNRANPFTRLGS